MAESITNKKIISFAGRNIDLDEFIRRALARAVEWMDYQGLKGDERTDFLNSFNTRLLNIVSGQSSNSETPSTTIAVGGNNSNDGTNYYNKDGERKQDNKPRGGIFGTVRRNGFNPELNVDVYLNGIAGTIPTIEELESAKKLTMSSTLKPFNQNTMGIYVGNSIFGEGNPTSNEQLAKWIDAYDKADESGNRSTEKRVGFIKDRLRDYRDALLKGEYNISDEDRNEEIKKVDELLNLQDYLGWQAGKLAPWLAGLLQNPTATKLTTTATTPQELQLELTVTNPTEADINPEKARLLKDGLTANDWARLSSIGLDVTSAISAFFPGYGTAVSALTGVGSTGIGAAADFTDDDVSAGQAWLGLGSGLLGDAVGLIPGLGEVGKGWKISRSFLKVAPKLINFLRFSGDVIAAKQATELYSKLSKEGLSSFDTNDLKTLLAILGAASLEGRIGGAKHTTKKVLEKAKKIEGQTTISTTKGEKVVDTGTAKKVMEAKTKVEADNALKEAAKTNPDLEGAEAVFGKRKKWLLAGEDVEVNKSSAGNYRRGVLSGNPKEIKEPETRYGRFSSLNPEKGNLYDFSNVKQRSSWFGRNFSNEAIVARRVGAVNYPGKPDYKAKLNENPATRKGDISEKVNKAKERKKKLDMKSATRAVEKGNTISLEKHINKATGVTLDKTNPNSKVNLRTAIEDLKKAGHTNEEISNMLTNKRFTLALKEHYKFKEGGVIPKFGDGTNGSWFDWIVKIFGGPSTAGSGFQPYNSAAVTGRVTGSGGKKVNTRTEKVISSKKEPSTTSGAEPATTSLATSTLPPSNKPETKPEVKPENKPENKPQSGKLEGTVGGLLGTVGEDEYKPTVDRPGGYNNETPERRIGNPSDLALTGIELGKFLGSMWANNAILDKYKKLRPYHRINPQQAYRVWSPKPLADLAEKARTDADQLGALLARGTNDQGKAAAYRITSHFKGEDAARPYDLQYNADIKESVNTALNIQNDNQEKRVDRVNDNHKADVAKFNQDRLAEIQRLHDNSTKLQQLGTTIQNGIARGALAQYENDYRSFLSSDPEIVRARTAYRNAKARYDANPNDNSAQRELTNAENALNNIITDKSNYWQSNHRLSLGYPFGPVIWTSPVVQSRPSFFAKGGNLEVVDKVERGRMRRHYDKLYYNAHKLLITESNKKQRAMANGYGYLLKLMMQSK